MLRIIYYKKEFEYFKTILNTFQAGVNIVNKDGIIEYVNDAYCKMNGYTREELVGHSLKVILPDKDPTTGILNFKKIISKKIKKPFVKEAFNTHKDGHKFPVLLSWNYLTDKNEVIGMVTVVQDLSKLKETESKLKKNHYELQKIKTELKEKERLEYLLGSGKEIKKTIDIIKKIAPTDFSVLITGKTGTGKEIIANSIHKLSKRKNKEFIKIDCGAISENLMESELFGHVKGAFTGAISPKKGAFKKANHGTIFLDEITNLNLNMQKKLLRVLQEQTIKSVGSDKTEKIDVRIIAASNEEILKLVREGKFRADLYYRLNEINIHVPSLKERKEDIPYFVNRFINENCNRLNIKRKLISQEALDVLINYDWKGNVRELQNCIKRAIVLSDNIILPKHLVLTKNVIDLFSTESGINIFREDAFDLKKFLKAENEKIEKKILEDTLKKFSFNKSKSAKFLNIDYKTILSKIKYYGLG